MGDFDWKGLLGSVAPMLGTAIGGPFGSIAGKMLGDALLGDENATEKQIAKAIQHATPADLVKLKEVEHNFTMTMKELDIKEEQLHADDRASARDMMTKTSMTPQVVLSAIFIGCYFALLYVLLLSQVTIKPEIKDMLYILVGILTREVPTIMQFWFGSSSGSKEKNDKLASKI